MGVESGVLLMNTKLPIDKCLSLETLFKPYGVISFEIKQHRIEVGLEDCPFIFRIMYDMQWSLSLVPKGMFIPDCKHDNLYDEVDKLLSSWNQYETDSSVINRMDSIQSKFKDLHRNHPEFVKEVEMRYPTKIRLYLIESEHLPSYLEAGHCEVMEQWYVHLHSSERKQELPPSLHSFVRGMKHMLTEWNINIIGISC